MRIITVLFFTFTQTFNLFSQDKGNFTFGIETNRVHYNKMDVFNRYLRDTTGYISSHFGDTYQDDVLKASFMYGASMTYQPSLYWDLGIYGTYQFSRFERNYQEVNFVGGSPMTYVLEDHQTTINNQAYSIGGVATIYLNKLFHFDKYQSTFMNRFLLGVGLKLGYTKSTFTETDAITNAETLTENGIAYYISNAQTRKVKFANWMGATELKLGYRFLDKNFFSTVGLKIGYQFHSSEVYRNDVDGSFKFGSLNEEMRLNFSGFYYGVFLNFGKK